jgi:molecular chaperone HtpG
MEETTKKQSTRKPKPIPFKAETRQILDILIHSLYTEREIFLRELISNASDALTRMDFELLTNREILDPQAELKINITFNKDEKTLTIEDTGIGMTADEMVANLGTIAHSGARDFIAAAQALNSEQPTEGKHRLSDLIGQFGVGFYSAFMVAESIRVTSRSFRPEAEAAEWFSIGNDTFTVNPAEHPQRGTTVTLKLKDDADDFLEEYRLREIVRKHSDFIPFPIFVGDKKEQANRQTALWRQQPREVEKKSYDDFYQQFTYDMEPPLTVAHMVVDAPVQMYALLFIPSHGDRGFYSGRKQEGLKLYARKVLIQDYNHDLLPEYLPFVQGVVDSEDLPLNVSRESVQANRMMAQLKKLVTNKVLDTLKKLSQEDVLTYEKFWQNFGRFLKHGISAEPADSDQLYPLLLFRSLQKTDGWTSLDDYTAKMKEGQNEIYYILGDDEHSVIYSPHLDVVRKLGFDVLLLTEPVDSFMLMQFSKYKDYKLTNVATAKLELPAETESGKEEETPSLAEAEQAPLIQRFKDQLGDRVSDVRMTQRLADSPARLVDPDGVLREEFQRVYRILDKEYKVPKKVLELNPRHPILTHLSTLTVDHPVSALIIEQVFEDALLIEGLHPDPASMIGRIQKIMEVALEQPKPAQRKKTSAAKPKETK